MLRPVVICAAVVAAPLCFSGLLFGQGVKRDPVQVDSSFHPIGDGRLEYTFRIVSADANPEAMELTRVPVGSSELVPPRGWQIARAYELALERIPGMALSPGPLREVKAVSSLFPGAAEMLLFDLDSLPNWDSTRRFERVPVVAPTINLTGSTSHDRALSLLDQTIFRVSYALKSGDLKSRSLDGLSHAKFAIERGLNSDARSGLVALSEWSRSVGSQNSWDLQLLMALRYNVGVAISLLSEQDFPTPVAVSDESAWIAWTPLDVGPCPALQELLNSNWIGLVGVIDDSEPLYVDSVDETRTLLKVTPQEYLFAADGSISLSPLDVLFRGGTSSEVQGFRRAVSPGVALPLGTAQQ